MSEGLKKKKRQDEIKQFLDSETNGRLLLIYQKLHELEDRL